MISLTKNSGSVMTFTSKTLNTYNNSVPIVLAWIEKDNKKVGLHRPTLSPTSFNEKTIPLLHQPPYAPSILSTLASSSSSKPILAISRAL